MLIHVNRIRRQCVEAEKRLSAWQARTSRGLQEGSSTLTGAPLGRRRPASRRPTNGYVTFMRSRAR